MTQSAAKTTSNRVRRRAMLKAQYFRMSRADELDASLAAAVEDYDAGMLSGCHFEGSGLVVIGESASGKTTELNYALQRLTSDPVPLECGLEKRFLQHTLEAESTWKSLGRQLLEQLGYPMNARRTEHEIWSRVRTQLKGQGIWLIHIDETQHMFQTLGEKETRKVINAIKTFMKHRDWPVIVILSGIPELLDKVNVDPQFRNLMTPVVMRPLNPMSNDLDEIDTAFYRFAETVDIDINDVRTEDTYLRMAYGHQDMYGRIFRFMVDVFASLPEGETKITMSHLADRYALKTGCSPGQNVFLREDYHACNVMALMAEM